MTQQLVKVDNLIATLKAHSRALRELKKVDPRTRFVLICPDHNNTKVGLGFHLLNCKPAEQVYDHASSLLKKDVLRICLEDPKRELDSLATRHVVAYVTNHACIAKLREEQPDKVSHIKASGGIGVGFINSLVFSGTMSFEDGLELTRLRAEAIEKACKLVPNASLLVRITPGTNMAKVCRAAQEHCLGLEMPTELAVCSVSKYIGPHLMIVSGHQSAIEFLEQSDHLFQFRLVRRIEQQACHTYLMTPVEQYLTFYLKHKMEKDPEYLKDPETCSVYSATAGRRLRMIKDIRRDISFYAIKPILIEQLFQNLYQRPKELAQPNTLVLWDRQLLKSLLFVNRRAWSKAQLIKA